MASTVGVSGFVTPDGRVDGATGFNTRAVVAGRCGSGTGVPRPPGRGCGRRWPRGVRRRGPGRRGGARAAERRAGQRRRLTATEGGTTVGVQRAGCIPGWDGCSWSSPPTTRPTTSAGSSAGVRAAAPAVDVLVADDNSPDGTGGIADELAARATRRCTCCTGRARTASARPTWPVSRGRASAATTRWWRWTPTARTPRSTCRRCWHAARDADVVIGSRWTRGGAGAELAAAAAAAVPGARNLYTRLALGMPVTRRHRRLPGVPGQPACEASTWTRCAPRGTRSRWSCPGWRTGLGCAIVEVPITFAEREQGDSKMSPLIVAVRLCWRDHPLGVRDRRAAVQEPGQARWP